MFYQINQKYIDYLLYFLLLIVIVWIKELNFLFYDLNESPDFRKYLVYLDHFFSNEVTEHEHGLLYYYLHSLHLELFFNNNINYELSLHKSIINVNFYIFIIGLIGIYKLLKLYRFSNKSIVYTLIFINFFPPAISLRLVLKPEILAFSLLPWVLLLLEKFKDSKNDKYLFMAIPLLVSIITLKGNILVIVCVYLLLSNFKIFTLLNLKNMILLTTVLLILFSLITIENNKSNGKNIFDIQSGSALESNYDFKAPKSVAYKTNLYKLFTSPVKHNHADSFIAITLLETNGDYFDLYWDNDATQYFKSRQNNILFEQSNEIKAPKVNLEDKTITIFQQRSTDTYLRETLSLLLSIIFFTSLIFALIILPKYRFYLISGFIGMFVILIHTITGYPTNNFDPLVGDTFKPLYYGFVLLLSASFLISSFSERNSFKFRHLIIYCLCILFILGFPKNEILAYDNFLIQKVESSMFCTFEKNIYFENNAEEFINCNSKDENIKNENFYSNNIFHKPFNLLLILMNLALLIYTIFEKNLNIIFRKIKFAKKK